MGHVLWRSKIGLISPSDPEVRISDRKVALDLPLNERGGYAKFSCTGSYRVQMHKEQTNKQTNFLLYIYIDKRIETQTIDIYINLSPSLLRELLCFIRTYYLE
jgi:hypothetical protein